MAALTNPVSTYDKPWLRVHSYGNHPPILKNPGVLERTITTAVQLGADPDKVCVLVPASGSDEDHFQEILPAQATPTVDTLLFADGAYTTEIGYAIAMPTGDCQFIVIKNLVTKMMVVVHGGKPAMTPGHNPKNTWINIMDAALHKAVEGADPTNLQIYVTGVIAPQDYRHDDENGQEHVRPFLEVYSADVFYGPPKDGCLDLFAVTKMVAQRHKVPEDQIVHDGVYTSRHVGMVSFRKHGTKRRNIFVAVNRHDW